MREIPPRDFYDRSPRHRRRALCSRLRPSRFFHLSPLPTVRAAPSRIYEEPRTKYTTAACDLPSGKPETAPGDTAIYCTIHLNPLTLAGYFAPRPRNWLSIEIYRNHACSLSARTLSNVRDARTRTGERGRPCLAEISALEKPSPCERPRRPPPRARPAELILRSHFETEPGLRGNVILSDGLLFERAANHRNLGTYFDRTGSPGFLIAGINRRVSQRKRRVQCERRVYQTVAGTVEKLIQGTRGCLGLVCVNKRSTCFQFELSSATSRLPTRVRPIAGEYFWSTRLFANRTD